MLNPFEIEGRWIKGNLHCHTTMSDGRLTPNEVIDRYKAYGYRFLSITDHNKIIKYPSDKDISLIPGVEISIDGSEYGSSFHIVVLGIEEYSTIEKLRSKGLNEFFNEIYSRGGYAFIAHPYWSSLSFKDLENIDNLPAIEVYNATCDLIGKGYSSVYWDALLAQGKDIKGLAVDDAHRYDLAPRDSLKGWIWLKVKEIDYEKILDSLRNGLFYASTGPEIETYAFNGEFLEASISPVYRVNLITRNGRGVSITVEDLNLFKKYKYPELELEIYQEDMSEVFEVKRYNIKIKMRNNGVTYIKVPKSVFRVYARLEIIDILGRYAWSPPLYI